MKWVNHVLIAGSVTAVYDLRLVPPTIIGATTPDWMEWVLKFVGRPVKHRTVTHYLSVWSLAWIAALFLLLEVCPIYWRMDDSFRCAVVALF